MNELQQVIISSATLSLANQSVSSSSAPQMMANSQPQGMPSAAGQKPATSVQQQNSQQATYLDPMHALPLSPIGYHINSSGRMESPMVSPATQTFDPSVSNTFDAGKRRVYRGYAGALASASSEVAAWRSLEAAQRSYDFLGQASGEDKQTAAANQQPQMMWSSTSKRNSEGSVGEVSGSVSPWQHL